MYRKCGYSIAQNNINKHFRLLWEQHVMWTRMFIISTAAGLGDLKVVTNRLLKNPIDFANILSQFYGNQKADKFKDLLTRHLLIAADLVNAAKNKDTVMVEETRKKWYANADDIADFLAQINPYWSKKEWQSLLYDHLSMTEKEAVSYLSGNYDESVKQYDNIENEALKMADYMSCGIINQFKV
jgi:hypothetical protein